MFGRRSSSPAAPVVTPKPGTKGRPTPRRVVAQQQRRKLASTPTDRKTAARQARERMRAERARSMTALRAGDESALPARDRGPVKRLVRDLVDSRRNVAEYFMPVAFLVLAMSVVSHPVAIYANLLFLVMLLAVVVDLLLMRHRVKVLVGERFPGDEPRGLTTYALMRSMQIRRMRLPPAKVKRGATI